MTFLSYASSLEDVLLWRALRALPDGFYIDAAARHPTAGSLTRAFYDRAWRGINVAPDQAACAALRAERPRDISVHGAEPTLAALCETHAVAAVHFFRADADGDAVPDLLAVIRPWIILQAAAEAPSQTLQRAGYEAVWFDGVNRFHLAEEQRPTLAAAFATPPNATDDFVQAGANLARRLYRAQTSLVAARADATLADLRAQSANHRQLDAVLARADELAWLRGTTANARAEADAHAEELARMRGQAQDAAERHGAERQSLQDANAWYSGRAETAEQLVATLSAQLRDLGARLQQREEQNWDLNAGLLSATAQHRATAEQLRAAQASLAAIHGSTVWRLTRPLRVRRARTESPPPPSVPDPPIEPPQPVVAPAPQPANPTDAPEPAHPAPPDAEPAPTVPPAPAEPPAEASIQTTGIPCEVPPALPTMRLAVHQFHAGSAPNDAITNAMLLIQRMLRAQGFASDIFVQQRGAGLLAAMRPADELPRHDRYALLLHHSTGYTGFDAIAALPAPKILMYHNITPPEFYQDAPLLQGFARLGREQLARLQGHVVASLAVSAFNAVELRSLGFPEVRTCTLLFDLAALRLRAAHHRRLRDPAVFTILFVGRITRSKAQDDLLAAFAAFRRRYKGRSRLVLPGALSPDEPAYLDGLRTMLRTSGLEDDVLLPGLIPEEELHHWYSEAHLYLSLSRHEGFGVPLVEAMVYGVPVLAWPAGAVPYTLGHSDGLLADRSPAGVATRILAVAENPACAAAMVERQHDALMRFELDRQAPALWQALALAGAIPPITPATRAAVAENVRFTIAGHVAGTYSLAAVNRDLARTIEAVRPGAVRLRPVEGEPTADLAGVPPDQRAGVAALAARAGFPTGPEIVISHHYPLYLPGPGGDLAVALFFWEESLIPRATVARLNQHFAAVFAPSRFVARVLVESGVHIPVLNIGQAPDLAAYAAVPRQPHQPFTVLHVSSAFDRKGVDLLLAAWAQAFPDGGDIRLIVKTFPNPHNQAATQIARLQAAHPKAPPIELIDREIGQDAMLALYARADCMALPTRGEGYNLVAAEAMAAGLPLIITGFGGHMDFCDAQGPATARLVGFRFAPSGSHLAPPHSIWVEPDVADLAAALREAVAAGPRSPEPARSAIMAQTAPVAFVDRLAAAAAALVLAPPAPKLRLAWVSSWATVCGVAEYSRALLDAMPAEGVERIAMLCDERGTPSDTVRPCWRRGDDSAASAIAACVMQEDSDVVVVQHQPGLLSWNQLAALLPLLVAQGRAVMVTLHNTRHLLEIAPDERRAVCQALAGVARVLVHTVADLNRLADLGLAQSICLFVHGAPLPSDPRVRVLPPDAAPLIGCYGFFLPGKGIARLIEAAALLRAEWPGLRLRLVNAEYDSSSAAEIARCRSLADAAGLAVEWHTAFLPMSQSLWQLAECDLIVLPYDESKEASSAALRTALGVGVPVAVTPIAIFDEAADAVVRLSSAQPAEIAADLAALLHDAAQRTRICAAAAAWLTDRSWAGCGERLHGMALGLAAQRHLGAPLDGSRYAP